MDLDSQCLDSFRQLFGKFRQSGVLLEKFKHL